MKLILVVVLAVFAASGCTKDVAQDRAKHKENAGQIKSTTEDTVKTMAQYDKIVAGRKAAARINAASASRKQDTDDFTAQSE